MRLKKREHKRLWLNALNGKKNENFTLNYSDDALNSIENFNGTGKAWLEKFWMDYDGLFDFR